MLRLIGLEDASVASTAARQLLTLVKLDREFSLLLVADSGGLATLVSVLALRLGDDDDDQEEEEGEEDEDEDASARGGGKNLVLTILEILRHMVASDVQVGVILISLGCVSAVKPLLTPRSVMQNKKSANGGQSSTPSATDMQDPPSESPEGRAALALTLQLLPSIQAAAAMLQMKWTPADLRQEVLSAIVHILSSHVLVHVGHVTGSQPAKSAVASSPEQFRTSLSALRRLFAPRVRRVARRSHLATLLQLMESRDPCTREAAAEALQTLLETCDSLNATTPRLPSSQKLGADSRNGSEESGKSLNSELDYTSMEKLYGDEASSDISITVMSQAKGKLINLKVGLLVIALVLRRSAVSTCVELYASLFVCVQAHRSVLAAYNSSFFKSFTSNPNTPDVKIQGIDHEIFSTVLKFLYTGEVWVE